MKARSSKAVEQTRGELTRHMRAPTAWEGGTPQSRSGLNTLRRHHGCFFG